MTSKMLYQNAVAWIAENDEPECDDMQEMADLISVALVADLWGKAPEEVAAAVLYRRRSNAHL